MKRKAYCYLTLAIVFAVATVVLCIMNFTDSFGPYIPCYAVGTLCAFALLMIKYDATMMDVKSCNEATRLDYEEGLL